MKKLILTTIFSVAGLSHCFSQGAIILNTTSALVTTNNGVASGAAAGAATYYYAVLDMTLSQYNALNGGQQASVTNLFSPSTLALWTYSGVNGNNVSLHAGGIAGNATANGNVASNWAQPTQNGSYTTASSYDYYLIAGWSANEGTSWGTVSNELATSTWNVTGTGSWFGVSALAYNYAGYSPGGTPGAVSVWATSAATGLAGSGGITGLVLTPITAVPEPSTMALAALGGASLLLFRRRQSK